jgi:purine-binding chemotaxis protein CheW
MKVSVLEFRLGEDIFCFDTQDIAYVFELENYTQMQTQNSAILGVVRYNDDVMLLVDTLYLYAQKNMQMEGEKSVVVIHDAQANIYGMLVDEILKIEELDKVPPTVDMNTQELIINHYKDQESIVNEIAPLPLLQKYHIAAMQQQKSKRVNADIPKHSASEYLLFRIQESLYAVASKYVQEVVEHKSEVFVVEDAIKSSLQGAVAVREDVIGVAKIVATKPMWDSLVIIAAEGKKVAIGVDEVFDIEPFAITKIESLREKNVGIHAFYNYKNRVVGIINPHYYVENVKSKREYKALATDTQHYCEYLTFTIAKKQFAIDMRSVGQVVETEMLSKTESSSIISNSSIKFITTWNKAAVSVADISKLLGIEAFDIEGSQTIFIEYKQQHIAFLVDEVDDIVYIKEDAVKKTSDADGIIAGVVVSQERFFITINENFLVSMC